MANIPNLSFNPTTGNFSNTPQVGSQNYQMQSIFMQPIGNIYGLSNSSEVSNIPMGNGVSVGLCLSEGTMYLKSMQNNGPVLLGYKISPLENTTTVTSGQKQDSSISKIEQILNSYEERFSKMEKCLESLQPNQKGGKMEWQV